MVRTYYSAIGIINVEIVGSLTIGVTGTHFVLLYEVQRFVAVLLSHRTR